MKLFSLISEDWMSDGGAVFGVVPKTMWSRFCKVDENNNIETTTRCLLVECENRLILFDTGMGDKQDEKFFKYKYRHGNHSLRKGFAEAGYTFDDVTDIVFTHLHYDHVGGAFENNIDKTEIIPVFKNAQYWCSKSQWENAITPNSREAASYPIENILPLKESGKLNLLEENCEFCKGINLRLVDGHTFGQIIPIIDYHQKTVAFVADFIPTPFHIPLPYVASYDIEPLKSMSEKERFLNEAFEKKWILMFQHDKENECCNLQKTGKWIKMNQSFLLDDVK